MTGRFLGIVLGMLAAIVVPLFFGSGAVMEMVTRIGHGTEWI